MPPRFRDWRPPAGGGLSLSNGGRTAGVCGRTWGQASAGWRTNDRENGARAQQKRASPHFGAHEHHFLAASFMVLVRTIQDALRPETQGRRKSLRDDYGRR